MQINTIESNGDFMSANENLTQEKINKLELKPVHFVRYNSDQPGAAGNEKVFSNIDLQMPSQQMQFQQMQSQQIQLQPMQSQKASFTVTVQDFIDLKNAIRQKFNVKHALTLIDQYQQFLIINHGRYLSQLVAEAIETDNTKVLTKLLSFLPIHEWEMGFAFDNGRLPLVKALLRQCDFEIIHALHTAGAKTSTDYAPDTEMSKLLQLVLSANRKERDTKQINVQFQIEVKQNADKGTKSVVVTSDRKKTKTSKNTKDKNISNNTNKSNKSYSKNKGSSVAQTVEPEVDVSTLCFNAQNFVFESSPDSTPEFSPGSTPDFTPLFDLKGQDEPGFRLKNKAHRNSNIAENTDDDEQLDSEDSDSISERSSTTSSKS